MSIGANYWASHAGIHMWRDWQAEVVAADFQCLSRMRVRVLRVFPLWPDFQPIHTLRKLNGLFVEQRHGEIPLAGPGDDPALDVGEDGVSRKMLRRFRHLADLAQEQGLSLIVGLITGWMSGRLFVPPALETLNPITDPTSIRWQIRLVRALVESLRDHPAVRAWDLGNECNCMGSATADEAFAWTATVANAIRAADSSRPVISGMHSLSADPAAGNWTIRDQGELTDILTVHPYALFTAHCNREPLNTMRPLLHAAAEATLSADLSGKPAIVEEFGTLGPMCIGDEEAAGMARVRVFDAWTHDARAALWWCAWDQDHLAYAPYDWVAVERELGMLRRDRSPKPVVLAMRDAHAALEALNLPALPPRRRDAVCLLTAEQDNWGVAYSAFVLAKQAGFDLRFHFCDRAIPPADLYLLPSVKGLSPLTGRRERELWKHVEAGAELYISLDDGVLGEFTHRSGVRIAHRHRRADACRFAFEGGEFQLAAPFRHQLSLSPGVETLASEPDGTPLFVKSLHGRGTVYSLLAPLESALAEQNEAFLPGHSLPFWKIYARLAQSALERRAARKGSPWLGMTEHPTEDGGVIVTVTNYTPEPIADELRISGYDLSEGILLGAEPVETEPGRFVAEFPPHSLSVWRLTPVGTPVRPSEPQSAGAA